MFRPEGACRRRLMEFVFDLTALAWAFGFLHCLDEDFFAAIHDFQLECGRELDGRLSSDKVCGARDTHMKMSDPSPRIHARFRGMIVVFKPPFWEVDGKSGALPTGAGRQCMRLSTFVQPLFPASHYPLPHWSSFDHGFLHRLDVPSSGLVLCGITMEGYYSLRLQLNTYRLEREYFVLCLGPVPPALKKIELGINSAGDAKNKSIGHELGRRAETHMQATAHLWDDDLLRNTRSCMAIKIRTGRRHQIRTHMLHCGHPIVCDAKYTLWRVCLQTDTAAQCEIKPPPVVESRMEKKYRQSQ